MRHVWHIDAGEVVCELGPVEHTTLAEHFELRDEGVRDGCQHWRVLAEVNFDPEDD